MKYQAFIEDNFLIDDQETGKLVPFKFRPIQKKYYDILCKEYDIERCGISVPIREDILKARKEGFTSLILAIFAADDITNKNPTEGELISYKDDATKHFRKRYRNFVLSFFARSNGVRVEDIQSNIGILEKFAPVVFEVDSNSGEYKLKHNGARFYCGTASARTGERGGTLHKLLFSEHAHYPDTPNMSAKEIVIGTTEQVSFNSGWVFKETTANGVGNFHHDEWWPAHQGKSRFRGRFFGWKDHYTKDQFVKISSQFTDKEMLRQEYPETPEEAFIASGSPYFDNERIFELLKIRRKPIVRGNIYGEPEKIIRAAYDGLNVKDYIKFTEAKNGEIRIYEWPDKYSYYIAGADPAEGKESGDNSVLRIINNETMKVAAKFKGKVPPDEFAKVSFLLGMFYNSALLAVEVNKDGLWVNSELIKWQYPNLYFREVLDEITRKKTKKFGWRTTEASRAALLSEVQSAISRQVEVWDKGILDECLTFVRNSNGRPEAISGKNDDEIFAQGIALMVRQGSPALATDKPVKPKTETEKLWDAVDKDIAGIKENNQADETWKE